MAAGFPGNPSCPSGRPDHPPLFLYSVVELIPVNSCKTCFVISVFGARSSGRREQRRSERVALQGASGLVRIAPIFS
eukprot:1176453-Prorocentrum_minimum.AAC.1